ncbi:hypothetical protein FSP39_011248 [Pinctada imbricata]|uniref:Uncharacterized protein n=1 Tax=Pinctada imbricata TaxID=66713 RepID=A0AA89C175_PINIB|nr:hypothetical protein FSP39_011248 [Pinctada imbricata]
MHFSSGASNLAGLSPGNRDTMDPIAELLSQLSSVRSRAAAAQSVSSQLQQLEMQLQSTRQQLERLPNRRQVDASKNNAANSSSSGSNTENQNKQTDSSGSSSPSSNSPYLLAKCTDSSENLEQTTGKEKTSRSFFIQELLLSTLTEQLNLQGNMDELASISEVLSISPAPSEGNGSGSVDSTSHNSNAQSKVAVRPTTPEKSNQASPAKSQTPTGGGSGGGGQGHPVRNHGYSQIGSTTPIRQNHGSHSQLYNSLPGSSAVLGGASFGAGNPHPLPGRPGAGARDRDSRVNPAAAKKSMFKQLPASQKSDREPPPH